LPAFVFYFNDHHIYLINDKDVRHALLNCNKTVSVCALAKEKKQKIFTKDLIIDTPFENWINYNKTNIYISENRIVHNNFYKLACAGDVWNVGIRMSEKEGIVQFKYENGNMIIYNPDIHSVIETIKVLNKNDDVEFIEDDNNKDISNNKYVFKNQRIHTLAREYLDKEFGGVPTSTFNTTGDYIFHSEFIRQHAFSGWFDKPKTFVKNLKAYDYNKHYSSCFMGQDIKYGWPIYNVFDEVEKFDGVFSAGFYYVKTSNFFPFRGNGFYDADLVDYGVESGIITKDDITFQYKSSYSLEPKHFEKFVLSVFEKFHEPKKALNALFGLFGHDFSNSNSHYFTTECKYAMMALSQNSDFNVKYVYHEEFHNETLEPINFNESSIYEFVTDKKPLCYHVYNMKRINIIKIPCHFFIKFIMYQR
jgi:hypothetical protein